MSARIPRWRAAANAFFATTHASPVAPSLFNATIDGADGSLNAPAPLLPTGMSFADAVRVALPLATAGNVHLLRTLMQSGGQLREGEKALKEEAIRIINRLQAVGRGGSLSAYFGASRQAAGGRQLSLAHRHAMPSPLSPRHKSPSPSPSPQRRTPSPSPSRSSPSPSAPPAAELPTWYDPGRFAQLLAIVGMRPSYWDDWVFSSPAIQVAFPGVSLEEWTSLLAMPRIGIKAQCADKSSALCIAFRALACGEASNRLLREYSARAQATRRGRRGLVSTDPPAPVPEAPIDDAPRGGVGGGAVVAVAVGEGGAEATWAASNEAGAMPLPLADVASQEVDTGEASQEVQEVGADEASQEVPEVDTGEASQEVQEVDGSEASLSLAVAEAEEETEAVAAAAEEEEVAAAEEEEEAAAEEVVVAVAAAEEEVMAAAAEEEALAAAAEEEDRESLVSWTEWDIPEALSDDEEVAVTKDEEEKDAEAFEQVCEGSEDEGRPLSSWTECVWPLLCGISHAPLHEPSRGPSCTHMAWFESMALKEYMTRPATSAARRSRSCPQHGCAASFATYRGIRVDEEVQRLIQQRPTDTDGTARAYLRPPHATPGKVWLRRGADLHDGTLEVRHTQPPCPAIVPHTQERGRTEKKRRHWQL